jgi:hypothetical protein
MNNLKTFEQYNLLESKQHDEIGEKIYNYILKNSPTYNYKTGDSERFVFKPTKKIINEVDPLGEEDWNENDNIMAIYVTKTQGGIYGWPIPTMSDYYITIIDKNYNKNNLEVSKSIAKKTFNALMNMKNEKDEKEKNEKERERQEVVNRNVRDLNEIL